MIMHWFQMKPAMSYLMITLPFIPAAPLSGISVILQHAAGYVGEGK
jgi:hypothetical protein